MIKIADISMDTISIEIQGSSGKALGGIVSLEKALTSLNSKLSGVQNNVAKYGKNMQNVGNILKKFKLPKMPKISEIFKNDKQQNPLKNMNNNKNNNGGDGNKNKNTKKNTEDIKKAMQSLQKVTSSATRAIRNMFAYLGKVVLLKGGLKGLNAIFGGLGSKVTGLAGSFRTLAKNLSKYSLALFGIRSAFYAVRNTSNEFLSSQDAVAKQLSANISYLKFSIGSMLAPVIEYITNLIYKLLQAIQALVYYFAKINIFAGKTAKNYAAMSSGASKATKEAQKQLQAFDELNNINFDKNDGGGGGAGTITPSFDLSEIDDKILPKFDDIENLFRDFANKINGFLGSIEWDSIIDKTTKATKKIAQALNAFTEQLDFNLIGYTISQGFNTVFANLNTFFSTYDFSKLGNKLGQGINTIIYTLNWQEMGKSMSNGFKAAIDVLFSMVTKIQWKDLGIKVGEAIKSAFANIDWKKVGQTINIGVNGILDAILETLENMDVDTIAKDIGDMLGEIDFGEIFKKLLKIGARVVEGLGKILWESIFSGDGDLAKILFIIIDFVVVKRLIKLLFSSFGESVKNNLVQSMSGAKKEGNGLTNSLNNTNTAATNLKTGFNNLMTSFGKGVQAIAILGGIRLVLDGLTNLLKVFAETGLSVGDALGFVIGVIAALAVAFIAMNYAMSKMDVSWTSIAGAIVVLGGFALVLNQVANLLDVFAKSGKNVGDVIGLMLAVVAPIVILLKVLAGLGPEMVVGLLPFLAVIAGISAILEVLSLTLPTILDAAGKFAQVIAPVIVLVIREIFDGIIELTKAIGEILIPLIEKVGEVFEKVFNGIANIVQTIGNLIKTVFEGVANVLSTIFNGIGTVFKTVFDGIAKVTETIGKTIKGIFESVGKTFETILNGIARVTESIGNTIKSIFEGVGNALATIFNGIGLAFERVFNGIANIVRAVGEVITNIFNGISRVIETVGKAIEGVLRTIGWLIETVLNSLLNFIWQIGPAVEHSVNAILRSVTRLINFMISAVEYLINTVIVGGINAIIKAINSVSQYVGINISLVPKKHIPRFSGYEDGGFPKEADFFYANENGVPEMVGRIGNKTAVANNDQITKAIADATYTAFVQALGDNSNNTNQPLNIYIGNEKVYKGYTKQQSQMSNQYGVVI